MSNDGDLHEAILAAVLTSTYVIVHIIKFKQAVVIKMSDSLQERWFAHFVEINETKIILQKVCIVDMHSLSGGTRTCAYA